MLDFIRGFTTDPIESNPKMAALIAAGAGYIEGSMGPLQGLFKMVLKFIS